MKTAEQVREEAAQIADGLGEKWRKRADEQQKLYNQAWIGGTENRKNAMVLYAAADGVATIAKLIRGISISDV